MREFLISEANLNKVCDNLRDILKYLRNLNEIKQARGKNFLSCVKN